MMESAQGNFSNSSLKAINNRENGNAYRQILNSGAISAINTEKRQRSPSPYAHRPDEKFGSRAPPMPQAMAAEITVHNRRGRQRSSAENRQQRDSLGNI